jgi:hypothetical protein
MALGPTTSVGLAVLGPQPSPGEAADLESSFYSQEPEPPLLRRLGTNWEAPALATGVEPAPAAERGEHWWPVATAIIVVAGLHVALPGRYWVQPAWVAPVVLLALLTVLIAGDPGRVDRQKTWLRVVTGIVIALITVASLLAAVRLVVDILTSNKLFADNPTGLLATGGVVWAASVIAFGLWYWDLDRGRAAAGPTTRTGTRRLSSPRCCTPTTQALPGCRGSSTTCRWPSGPPRRSARPTFQRSSHGPRPS